MTSSVPPCPHVLPLPPVAACAPGCDVKETGHHVPGCPWFDAALDPADYGPTEVGPKGDEYDWLVPNGPEDPDRVWDWRDSGIP